MDLARASCGTSAVAEYYAWSAGIIPRPHHTALCAHVTTVWKRGGHPRQPASRNLGISATLTKRCQDPTYEHYLSVLNALSKEELANFDWEACHTQIVEELIGIAGLTMNEGTIVAQCTRLPEKLHAHVNDHLTLTTANMTVKGRLTTLLQTPLNPIKQRLSLSSARGRHKTIQRATSANSLDELLNDSPSHNKTTMRRDSELGDSLFGLLSSLDPQLLILLED